jgi:hypothetical protein
MHTFPSVFLIVRILLGPIINGKPALSNAASCASANAFLTAFSFESSIHMQDASFLSVCKGVLLDAAGASPSVCACKFLVPHFSSFGVRPTFSFCRCFMLLTIFL